jgi:hypothetical protein
MNKILDQTEKRACLSLLGKPRDGSNVTYLHTSGAVVGLNQGLLARLEAENAQLRSSVVDLFLQIQALRDGSTSRNRF